MKTTIDPLNPIPKINAPVKFAQHEWKKEHDCLAVTDAGMIGEEKVSDSYLYGQILQVVVVSLSNIKKLYRAITKIST